MRGLFCTALVIALLTRGESIQAKLSSPAAGLDTLESRTRFLRIDEPADNDLLENGEERARLGTVAKLLKERKALQKELKIPTTSIQQKKFEDLFKSDLTPKQAFQRGKFKTRVEAEKYEKFYKLAKAKLAAKVRMERAARIQEARAERVREAEMARMREAN